MSPPALPSPPPLLAWAVFCCARRTDRRLVAVGRPLSDLGQLSYKSYWTEVLVQLLWEEKCTKKMTHSTVSPLHLSILLPNPGLAG